MLRFIRDLFRPVCPACAGEGGAMSGYYEPEFSECMCCYYDRWYDDANPTRVWRWWGWLYMYREWRNNRHFDRMIEIDSRRWSDLRVEVLPTWHDW